MNEEKPNIVFIVMDTARADAFLQRETDLTPNIDAIAADGISYSRAFSVSPWTLPSHASLFTGTTPSKHGAHAGHKQLENEQRLLPEVLSEAGYRTVGISNNTWISEEFGFARGFDVFRKNWQYIQSDVDLGKVARAREGVDKLRGVAYKILDGNPVVNVANAVYGQLVRKQAKDDGAQSTNDWIRDWLAQRDTELPFFLFVNYLEPHLEYRPPREYVEPLLPEQVSYEEAMEVNQDAWRYIAQQVEMDEADFEILEALYRAEISYLDQQIGELQEYLKNEDEWEETIFVVTGDHGENIGDHGLMDHQYGLYDTLLHIPLIINGGGFAGGTTIDELVQLPDLAPTLLDAADIDAPQFRKQMLAKSFHPQSETEPRDFVVAEYMAPQPSMEALEKRVGDLPDTVYDYNRSLRALRSDRWKLIRGSDDSMKLFDLKNDPDETSNIARTEDELREELNGELDGWLDSFEQANYSGTVEMQEGTKEQLEDLGYLQ
ncbi:sulfatase [Halovenus rubra]|uniref:Sulfatase n=2 Tax=Halovenus rubra TaxID=869890 RepID=A0ACC7DV07_9EURY|nr:sulfatase [Halovenus rubra]